MRIRHLLPVFAVLSALLSASAQADLTPFEEAKVMADSGKNAEALELLQKMAAKGPHEYYNLGTLSLRVNRFGPAVAYLEKAYQLKPFDSDIRHNLNLARTELARVIGATKLDPASNWLETFGDLLAPPAARAAIAALGLLFLLLGYSAFRKTGRFIATLGTFPGVLGLLGVLLSGVMLEAEWLHRTHPAAMCVERLVIRSGPGDHFLELSAAEAGMKLRVLGAPSQTPGAPEIWYQIRYAEDRVGWVRGAGLLLL